MMIILNYIIYLQIFDAGNYFQICMRVDEDDEILGYKAVTACEEGLGLEDPIGYL